METKEALISVIVPVYKVEKYLDRCVQSILNQTYQNMEILLVDDGSPDNCGKLCDMYAQQESRIIALHKKNGGLSSARNYGIDHAQGEYLAFVDSDDWIEPDMIDQLYRAATAHNVDVSCCNINTVGNKGLIGHWREATPGYELLNKQQLMKALATDRISTSSCNKLFKRHLFEGIRYVEGMLYEDLELMHRCLYRANGGVYVGKPLYNYFMNDEGITKSHFTARNFDFTRACKSRLTFYEENCIDSLDDVLVHYLGICMHTLDRSVKRDELREKREEVRTEIFSCLVKYPHIKKQLGKKEQLKLSLLSRGFGVYDWLIGLYATCIKRGKSN